MRSLAAKMLPELIVDLLRSTKLELGEARLIEPHQANGVMLAERSDTLRLEPGQTHMTVRDYGNTGAASVPNTLDDGVRKRKIKPGDALLHVAFGGGVTWGGVTMRWTTNLTS
ncbi:3-oxoacyl-[acyl-carrier-protein] synthase III C-terminal domain-containing protein [Haloechinothrix salitolerans]|uniref:3-oxoacyl-[acyl-carrier-protein] synthase III C-terminal domain-containing protein n=1 Tax=Haloechinothrix salitolerans TaxID=926830 RepID=A0ABW2C1R4_9PSEU